MSLAAHSNYDSYKSSGVDWIGDVPSTWQPIANKHLFNLRKQLVGKRAPEYVLLSLTLKGLIKRDMENPEGKFPAEFDTYQEVHPGDFVFCLFDVEETPRTVGLSRYEGMITGAYTVFRPVTDACPTFLYYFYLNADTDKKLRGLYRGLRNTIPKESFGSFKVPLPQPNEQRAIAAFLDEKCAKIDEAVRIKETQIKLLRERRQILIQQAVTRGLNPNAPMKDSGIDWIGQIPAHWETQKISHIGFVGNGSTPSRSNTSFWDGGDIPWLNSSKVNDFVITKADQFVTAKAKRECHLPLVVPGDIVMGITGQGKTRGMVAKSEISATINQHLAYIRVKSSALNAEYLLYFLVASYEWMRRQSESNGSTKGAITCEDIKRYVITVPPVNEQSKIVANIRDGSKKIKNTITIKESQITKLKEYKTTLINGAVTGKIKVGSL